MTEYEYERISIDIRKDKEDPIKNYFNKIQEKTGMSNSGVLRYCILETYKREFGGINGNE